MRSPYFVRPDDVAPYHPANHTGTVNRRLIGRDNVGAKSVEVVLGVIEKGKGALPHSHPGIEQVCYVLEGRAHAEIGGQSCELGVGDCCFFPPDTQHVFTVVSDEPVKVLVIYSPPYGERVTGQRPDQEPRRKGAKTQRKTRSAKNGGNAD